MKVKTSDVLGVWVLFILIITSFWQGYELYEFGELRPDPFHTIITVGFSSSLTINYFLFKMLKGD